MDRREFITSLLAVVAGAVVAPIAFVPFKPDELKIVFNDFRSMWKCTGDWKQSLLREGRITFNRSPKNQEECDYAYRLIQEHLSLQLLPGYLRTASIHIDKHAANIWWSTLDTESPYSL